MLFLQEQMVAITTQLSIPLIEVSLVIQKYCNILLTQLEEQAKLHSEQLPENISKPWPISTGESSSEVDEAGFTMDPKRLVEMTDSDRMDILDTVIRTAINDREIPLSDALLIIRDWEQLSRKQLAAATSPGQLFSPLELPEGY